MRRAWSRSAQPFLEPVDDLEPSQQTNRELQGRLAIIPLPGHSLVGMKQLRLQR
jgi:hypothetical protein